MVTPEDLARLEIHLAARRPSHFAEELVDRFGSVASADLIAANDGDQGKILRALTDQITSQKARPCRRRANGKAAASPD